MDIDYGSHSRLTTAKTQLIPGVLYLEVVDIDGIEPISFRPSALLHEGIAFRESHDASFRLHSLMLRAKGLATKLYEKMNGD